MKTDILGDANKGSRPETESFIGVRLWCGLLAVGEMKHKSVKKRFMRPDKPISLINQCHWINYFCNVGFRTLNYKKFVFCPKI